MVKFPRNKKEKQQLMLSEGILLSGGFHEQQEKRLTDYFVRAVFLFAIVTGSLGGMLSAFDITYEKWAFFTAAALASLYCASLYFASWWENVGYVLIFIFVLNAGFGLQTHISSGFYGILNDIASTAATFFGSNAQVSYAEQVENHSFAISVAMCYFALIGCVLANGLISRKMRYLPVTVFSVFFLLVPLYLEREPSGGYVILLAIGIITVYILRQNKYLCRNIKEKASRRTAAKHLFSGSFFGRAAMGALLTTAFLCTIVVGICGLLIPKNTYMTENRQSALKLQTMDVMENFYLMGIMGLINFYPTTGGLVNGRLGGVNSVRLDYETDLTLEFAPYSYDKIYLKSFVGAEYVPYENHWRIADELLRTEGGYGQTIELLKAGYDAGVSNHAKGTMKIRNVAAMSGTYLPYYSEDFEKIIRPGMEQAYTFYPLLSEHLIQNTTPLENETWLEIPEQNRQTIANFCAEAGLSGSEDEIISQLRSYFQENFPYTLSPGITPRNKDFVNYFLTEKRKGYCAHYACSAALILRYMGIPARYVEGYAVDALDIAENGELTDHDVSQYYDGTSLLSQQSVISYDASDGNAHAWVEVYDQNLGWHPVEFTPYQTEEEESQDSIWDMFLRLFQNGQTDADSDDTTGNGQNSGINAALRTSVFGFVIILGILLMAVPTGLLVKKLVWFYRYYHADRNGKLLMQYKNKIHRLYARNNKNRVLKNKKNFEEQVAWLSKNGFFASEAVIPDHLIRTLNQAAYSPDEISSEAFTAAMDMIH